MKLISYKHIVTCIGFCLVVVLAGCDKVPVDPNTAHYLRFSNAFTTISNNNGATRTFTVESDIAWKLTVTAPLPDWMTLSTNTGIGSMPVTVTATRNNNTGGYRFAEVIASAVNDPNLLPIRMTIVQFDSTYKGK